MISLFTFLLFATCISGLSEESTKLVQNVFSDLKPICRKRIQNEEHENINGPIFTNLLEKNYFYKANKDTRTLVVAIPRNPFGVLLAQKIVSKAHKSFQEYGFQPASLLVQYSLWSLLQDKVPACVEADSIHITKSEGTLEIISTGFFSAGIYRQGELLRSTRPVEERSMPAKQPVDLLHRVNEKGEFVLQDLKHVWDIEKDDMLLLSWIDSSNNLEEVLQIAMKSGQNRRSKTGQILRLKVSDLVSTLKAIFDLSCDGGKPFVIMRLD
ncbi:hypothetical protein OXX80_003328 [Metschnikowia pulcherrima]